MPQRDSDNRQCATRGEKAPGYKSNVGQHSHLHLHLGKKACSYKEVP